MASACRSESSRDAPTLKRRRRSNSSERQPGMPASPTMRVQEKSLIEAGCIRQMPVVMSAPYPLTFDSSRSPSLDAFTRSGRTPVLKPAASHDTETLTVSVISQERMSDWWLPAGDLVLGVENLLFRIHKSVLSESSIVFQDMFELSRPTPGDNTDDLPFVRLHDAAGDWIETLKWLYNGVPAYTALDFASIPFSTIRSHLTISNKYEIETLRSYAQQALEALYPANLSLLFTCTPQQHSVALLNAADAILLGRTSDLPSVLPAAFYYLSTAKWRYNEDSGKAHAALSPVDLRRLIVGREALQDASIRLATTLSVPFALLPPSLQESLREDLDHGPHTTPVVQSFCFPDCANAVLREWSATFFSPDAAYKNPSLLRTLKELAERGAPGELCAHCSGIRGVWLHKQANLVIRSIPGWFGL